MSLNFKKHTFFKAIIYLIAVFWLVPAQAEMSDEQQVNAVLNDYHKAAEDGDAARYLGHMTPNSVFLGTDDWERWPYPEFAKYVEKGFANGSGWTYKPESRQVMFDQSKQIAWFDEITVSPKWGKFRGTGVLRKVNNTWKIESYALAFLVPNEAWEDVSKLSKAKFSERNSKKK